MNDAPGQAGGATGVPSGDDIDPRTNPPPNTIDNEELMAGVFAEVVRFPTPELEYAGGATFDASEVVEISAGGKVVMLRVRSGERRVVDLFVDGAGRCSLAALGELPEDAIWPGNIGILADVYSYIFEGVEPSHRIVDLFDQTGDAIIEPAWLSFLRSWYHRARSGIVLEGPGLKRVVHWSVPAPSSPIDIRPGQVNWCVPVSMAVLTHFHGPVRDPAYFAGELSQEAKKQFFANAAAPDGKNKKLYDKLEAMAEGMGLKVTQKWSGAADLVDWNWFIGLGAETLVARRGHAEVVHGARTDTVAGVRTRFAQTITSDYLLRLDRVYPESPIPMDFAFTRRKP